MGTHPIFESDFDCLTDHDMKKMGQLEELSFPDGRHVSVITTLDGLLNGHHRQNGHSVIRNGHNGHLNGENGHHNGQNGHHNGHNDQTNGHNGHHESLESHHESSL